jgi:hypothetical protein
MTLPRSAADVLASHVLFEIEAIDRMYLNLYQPRLQHGAGVAAFFVGHRGHRFASSALMAPMTRAFVADIEHFIAARDLGLVRFAKGQRKNEVTGATYPWLVPSSGMINQYYFYCVDEEFGPVCVKFSGYFPYTGRLILNGNEYAKRQAAKAGIGFVPLDNAFVAVDDLAAVQAICDGLDAAKITALAARLLAMLPHPFTAEDTAAGYRYELSVLQAEFSLTQALDTPVNGRIFSGQLIRDNLDIGRPDRVSLIFDRRIIRKGKHATPGLPHPGDHRRRHPEPAHRLQELQDQAVPQAGQGAADRNHDQRHQRLRRGQGAVSSPGTQGDRLHRQQAPA